MTEQTELTVSGKPVLHYPDKNTRTLPNFTVDTYTKVILRITFFHRSRIRTFQNNLVQ